MNNHQIRHIAQVANVTAFAQFGVFGYAGLQSEPIDWLAVVVSGGVFALLQLLAGWVLGSVREEKS